MKPWIWILLGAAAVMLLSLAGCKSTPVNPADTQQPDQPGSTAHTGTVSTEPAFPTESTELRFSSFDGGGYSYSAVVEDPAVAEFSVQTVYGSPSHDVETGSPYDVIFTLRGLHPGSTKLTVTGISPILEPEMYCYTLTVDDSLQVTVSAVRTLSRLFVSRTGSIAYPAYEIKPDENGYVLLVNEEASCALREEAVDAIMQVFDTYALEEWDGFNKAQSGVLDGEGFWLEFVLTDGTSVRAHGENAFPPHYFDAMGALWAILTENSP